MQPGITLRNHYRIIKSLGTGGFGDTYLALDEDLPGKPKCVVKHLKPKSSNPGILPIAQTLFEREANTLDKLGKYHQEIPQLLAHFQEEGEFYLVQQYIDGQDISKELIPGKKLSESYTIKLLKSILEVLAFVHQENVIHRDIKPQNLMRRRHDGKIVLIDFGAVKEISTLVINAAGETTVTVAVGTPGYMPSEQAIGKPKFSSDVYAVGMIGIQALTGRKPHQLPEDMRTGNILWRDKAEVSEELADIIDKMVRDHFSQRYQDATEALEAFAANIEVENESVSEFPPLITSTQTFTTVKVDGKGAIIERRQEQAEVMTENLGNGVILEMVLVPGGSFLMGSPDTEAYRRYNESPQHYVNVPTFLIGKYPVTQAQWEAIMENNPSSFIGTNFPVEKVSWNDALEFCQRLSEMTGKNYRLPSEAEWEYACRAGTTTPFYFGETITSELANCNSNYYYQCAPEGSELKKTLQQTTNVGSFPPNAFGLYDMHGNVREWCQDIWHDNYNHAPTDGTAWESRQNNDLRLLRGGAWYDLPKYCRCADRVRNRQSYQVNGIGFRVVIDTNITKDSPNKSTKITLPSSSLPQPLPQTELISSTQTFSTVKVNEKGEIIERRQQQAQIIIEHLPNDVILEMVLIPGGSFLMGSPDQEVGRTANEIPQHYVDVPPFLMGKYPVTQKQWEAVMGNNPAFFKGANLPIESVSWNDAIHFCQRLSQIIGKNYRLPTEAEWEYACRARTTTPFYFGETITSELANYNYTTGLDNDSPKQYRQHTTDVGNFPPNAFGLYDMHGNVWEWCQDIWHGNYHGAPRDGSAWETGGSKNRRLLRGGSWLNSLWFCRSTLRYGLVLKDHQNKKHFGFRVATDTNITKDSPNKSTKITLPSTSLSEPLPQTELISSTQTFTTVTVNAKGEIIQHRQQQAQIITEHLPNGVILEMVLVPGGRFLMGSPDTELKRTIHESPQHYVDVPAFFMGKYPVTQAQWEAVMENNPSFFRGANLPVEKVSWNDAIQFCQRLSQISGKNYRLPTEVEWEYACRARTTTPFYFGETITTELANYRGSSIYASEAKGIERQETTDIGNFPPNAFGLYDMHGNVWEWCQDVWHYNYDNAPTDGSIWKTGGDSKSDSKLLRGGSWSCFPKSCRSANRVRRAPMGQDDDVGFRLVMG